MRRPFIRLAWFMTVSLFLFAVNFLQGTKSNVTLAQANAIAIADNGIYLQNFDTLIVSGTHDQLPTGWTYNEKSGDGRYIADNGSNTKADTYSLGNTGSLDRALGGNNTKEFVPTFGAEFVNDTGITMTEVTISYVGELWRLGETQSTRNAQSDKIDTFIFEYSIDATSLDQVSGTWVKFIPLNMTTPSNLRGIVGARDGNEAHNRQSVTGTITGLTIANGQTFWIRWTDQDIKGDDDRLAIDDFTITVDSSLPIITPTSVPTPNLACGTTSGASNGITKIGQLQVQDASIYQYQYVTIEGIVVGDFQGVNQLDGFFVQNESNQSDNNPATSDGIFIYTPGVADSVSVGERVRVYGQFIESNHVLNEGMAHLTNVTIVDCGVAPVPAPIVVTLPVTNSSGLERYEGMYVTFPQTLTVTEHHNIGYSGEITLSADGRLFEPTNIYSSSITNTQNINTLQQLNNYRQIRVDDNSRVFYPNPVPFLGTSPNSTLRLGDSVQNIQGILNFRNGTYRLQPTIPIANITFQHNNPRPSLPASVGGTLKIASFNVLNYFTTIDDGTRIEQESEPRGADSKAEFRRQRQKIVSALLALDADIIGLIELENNQMAIEDLVATLNISSTVPYTIVPGYPASVASAGDESPDLIKVGIIYRPTTVTAIGSVRLDQTDVYERPPRGTNLCGEWTYFHPSRKSL